MSFEHKHKLSSFTMFQTTRKYRTVKLVKSRILLLDLSLINGYHLELSLFHLRALTT